MNEIEQQQLAQQLENTIQYPVAFEAIKAMATEYMPLKINGILDKEGQMIVRTARLDVRKHRVAVEHKRKALKADALEYGRQVDSAAKLLTEELIKIEGHLKAEEAVVQGEIDRIAQEEEKRKQAVLQDRLDKLTAVGCMMRPTDVEAMDDDTYDEMLVIAIEVHETKKAEKEAERKRLAAEEAERKREAKEANEKRKVEEDRLAAERKKLEAEKAKLEEEKKQWVEDEQRDAKRRVADEKRREEEAQYEEEVKAKQEEQLRREAMRPDLEKLAKVADAVDEIKVPQPSLQFTVPQRDRVFFVLRLAATQIRAIAAEGTAE